jgi:hypothetical protein
MKTESRKAHRNPNRVKVTSSSNKATVEVNIINPPMGEENTKTMSLDKVAFETAFKTAVQPVLDQFQVNLKTVDAAPVSPDEDVFTVSATVVTPAV